MHSRVVEFLEENKLIDIEQHGYRSNKSDSSVSIDLVECIIDAIDRGENMVGIFMDLSMAFKSVSQPALI